MPDQFITPYQPSSVPDRPRVSGWFPGIPDTDLSTSAIRIHWARRGIPGNWLSVLVNEIGLGNEIATALDMTPEQLQAKSESETLDSKTSEAVLDLARILARCVTVWESRDQAVKWLSRPIPVLDDQAPVTLLDTFEGRRWVMEVLCKIEHGDFS